MAMRYIVQDDGAPEGGSKCLIGPTDTYWRAARVQDYGGCSRMYAGSGGISGRLDYMH